MDDSRSCLEGKYNSSGLSMRMFQFVSDLEHGLPLEMSHYPVSGAKTSDNNNKLKKCSIAP